MAPLGWPPSPGCCRPYPNLSPWCALALLLRVTWKVHQEKPPRQQARSGPAVSLSAPALCFLSLPVGYSEPPGENSQTQCPAPSMKPPSSSSAPTKRPPNVWTTCITACQNAGFQVASWTHRITVSGDMTLESIF